MDFILLLFIISLLTFVGFIFFSYSNYEKRFKNKYNIKNMFPYELNFESKFQDNLLGNLFLVLFIVSSVVLSILLPTMHRGSAGIIFLMVTSILAYAFLAFVCFVPLKFLKFHLLVSVIFICFSFAAFGAIAFAGVEFYNLFLQPKFMVIAVFGFIFLFLIFMLLMNPKLSTWAKVDVIENPDGTTTPIRPKYFVLAFTEWLTIFSNVILLILTFVLHICKMY